MSKPINEMASKLRLPSTWLVHNTFHVSLVKLIRGSAQETCHTKEGLKIKKRYFDSKLFFDMNTRCYKLVRLSYDILSSLRIILVRMHDGCKVYILRIIKPL